MQKTVSRRAYIAIDLKSFYASVECIERGLDPLTTNLVVANPSRTEKTICLAVSPPLKSYGVPGRPRLFEVIQRIREVNEERRIKPACHRHRDVMHARDVFQRPKRRHLRIEAHHLIDVFLCEKLLETAVFCRALKA